MDQIRRVIHECHRRSLWQVLAVYLVGAWGALQGIQAVTDTAGLPDWVPPGALILLMIGLPIVLATAFVQEGIGTTREIVEVVRGGPEPTAARSVAAAGPPRGRFLTWRRAIVGGVVAFAVLAGVVGVYTFMWSNGVGPVGNLVAQGVLDERERVVLADFGNATTDSLLDEVVTEALRVDLTSSKAITVVEPAFVRQVLQRMGRDPDARMGPEVAREAAVREGIKALIEGDVGSAGSGFVLTARIVSAADGSALGAFRETARDNEGILDAIDRLSQAIRNKAGESLTSIRETGALEEVTTGSLDALRLYTQALAVSDQGDTPRGIALLEEALALDPDFAMAWRKLAALLQNSQAPVERRAQASSRAYELRDRLTPRERLHATAFYFLSPVADQDRQRAAQAYRSILDEYPDDGSALNNLAIIAQQEEDFAGAVPLLERAVSGAGETSTAHLNLVRGLYRLGREEDARAAYVRAEERYPNSPDVDLLRFQLAFYGASWDEADSVARALLETDRPRAANHYERLGMIRVAQGRLAEAAPFFRQQADQSATNAYTVAIGQAAREARWLEDAAAARRTLAAVLARYPLAELPAEDRPYPQLAEAYAVLGDARETEDYVRRHETERPGAAQGPAYEGTRALILGQLALAQKDFDAAEQHFRDRRRIQPCLSCNRLELGIALAGAGKHEEALRELETRTSTPQFNTIVSIPTLEEPLVLEQLARSNEALGRKAEAAAAYEKFAELWKGADAALQPRVQRAREKAQALRATP